VATDPLSSYDPSDPLSTNSLCFWVLELQAGRPNAAEPVLRKIQASVKDRTEAMFRKFQRVGRFTDLQDVIQGAMLRLLCAMRAIRPESTRHFYALVNTAIRRELLDLIKKYFGPSGPGQNLSECPLDTGSGYPDPAAAEVPYGELERMSAFHRAVERLPPEECEAFGLKYYHGWSQSQIADLFQVSVRTVNRWQREAERQLRERLGAY
jgi:RNA polymerase sigma-70 factor (ECF subfamily)